MIHRPKSAADDAAIIRNSQADVRAGSISPHPVVMHAAGIALSPEDAAPAERAVVWAATVRETAIPKLQADTAFRAAVAHAAAQLGRAAVGASGRVPDTYETRVAGTDSVLVFELVTWTKAGEVIAILALARAPAVPLREAPLWAR